ncbi:MAG: PAS domain-containing sensor histidine kinase [Bacteroidota bacterium]|nr:PAS domain-containing sensor histidine kinase [Bacteroidota bacterium]
MDDPKASAKSAYKLDHFFDLSPDLLCIAGFDGYFKKINPAVSKLLGYTNEELFSRPINDFVFHEDKEITSKMREELSKSKPLYNFENRYVTKSGELVWLAWTSQPVPDDKIIFAIAKNITHKKKLEEERNALLANLATINQELTQLSFTTSHDLRSPVNNLISVFSLLDVSNISDPKTLKFIEILKLSGQNLSNTLNKYVDQLTQKVKSESAIEELDFRETLEVVLQSINSLIENSKTTLHIDFSVCEKIIFNRAMLESVFLNLITNAIKYSMPDRLPVISIHSQKIKGICQLVIEDNGIGFDLENVKDKIFGLHQKFNNHVDSKGIGLYLVHNHITNSGGTIDVESRVNEGSKFIITFKSQLS